MSKIKNYNEKLNMKKLFVQLYKDNIFEYNFTRKSSKIGQLVIKNLLKFGNENTF